MLDKIFSVLLAPALISLLVSLWASRNSEAKRARRDHITKLFEVSRDDVRRGMESALDYFSTEPAKRTALQEAKVIFADKELKSAMPVLLSSHLELSNDNREEAQEKFEILIEKLTGGNFQAKEGEVDRQHMLEMAYAGAGLRAALARMRDAELQMLVDADPVKRFFRYRLFDVDMSIFDRYIGIKK